MSTDARRVTLIKLHKKWADGLTLIWFIIVLVSFAAVYYLCEQSALPAGERNSALVFLGTIVIVAAIWQAIGLGIARVHMIVEKLDIERSNDSPSRP